MQTILHSENFINNFKLVLKELYDYEEYMDFMVVPSLMRKKTLSYMPLLNYTDRNHKNIEDLIELAKDNEYQIRVLNGEYVDFKDGDTVSMRLDISNKKSEEIFMQSVKSRCRNKIKNSIKKNNFIFRHGNSEDLIQDFYKILQNTLYKHGVPVFDLKLFYVLKKYFLDDFILYVAYDDVKPIGGMCMILDDDIAWYSWGGIDNQYSKRLAGYFLYWKTLKHIIDKKNKKVFDFGRSGYGGNTFKFKSQFGAIPTKIDIIKAQKVDIYDKYAFASKVWRMLPIKMVNVVGTKLCKYLEDL